MTELSRKILEEYQIRKSAKQKEEFRSFFCDRLRTMGYEVKIEGKSSKNIVVGDPETAKVIYTAHYDTCPVLPIPNFITPRNMIWYLLYQLLLCVPMFVLAIGAEVGTMLLWEKVTGEICPLAVAMLALYAVLLFFLWWIYAGPANKHTVNDNTSGVLTLVEIAESLPEELRSEVALIFFDNEEKGLLGSSAFAKKHRSVRKNGLVVNFDCVSDGDSIQFFPSKRLKKAGEETLAKLEQTFLPTEEKSVEVVRGFGFYPSDQAKFKRGVGVCALKKSPVFGWYMDRIHTKKDTVLMEGNIHLLREGALRLAVSLAEKGQKIG
ncbi:MAG: M28 family peptidase [Oscillospiraceae bacterium]|nr:M28 family peptidase [Oscillospiraceae bacterium]